MGLAKTPQTDFVSGELDPLMIGRSDIDHYAHGAASLRNMRLLLHGGVRRRPGLEHKNTFVPTTAIGLLPFIFSDTQKNILAFSNARLDVYDTAGVLQQTLTSQPWTTAMLPQLRFTQGGDTMFLANGDLVTQTITRTGADTFAVANYAFEEHSDGHPKYQPYYKYAPVEMTLTPSSTTGASNLTVSSAYWTTDHENTIVRYKGKEIMCDTRTSSTIMAGTVRETLDDTTGDRDWDEQTFSAEKGWPNEAEMHEQRLWFLGSKGRPPGVWGSKIGAFRNFDKGTGLDDEAIWESVGDKVINEIRSGLSLRDLLIFTDRGEFYVPTQINTPITPETFSAPQQTPYGIGTVRPYALDGAAIFIQKSGKAAREMIFDEVEDAYTAEPISLLSPHLIKTPVDMSVLYGEAEITEQYAYLVNSDGTMSTFHTIRSQSVAAWAPWDTEGGETVPAFESICILDDEIFVCVERTIDGATIKRLEKFNNAYMLDASIKISGAATDTFGGLGHLEDQVVQVVSGGVLDGGTYTVVSGSITTEDEHTDVEIGLDFTTELQTLPPNVVTKSADFSGELKGLVRTLIRFDNTYSARVEGQDLILRTVNEDLGNPPTPATGWREFYHVGYDRDAQSTVDQDRPLPMTILSLQTEVLV